MSFCIVVVAPASASAYQLLTCRYPVNGGLVSINWRDQTGGGDYGGPAQSAVTAWHNTITPVFFVKVASGGNLYVGQTDFGNTGFDDVTTDIGNVIPPRCNNGIWAMAMQVLGACGLSVPQPDDIAGVNAIY